MNGRVVVITGASEGMGAAFARAAAKQGAKVVLSARREKELGEVAAETGGLAVVGDMTKRADVQKLLDAAVGKHGHVDVWVNNVGRGINRLVTQLTDSDLDDMMTVNVKSALYGMQVATEHFKARGAGHLINVSSMLGRIPLAPPRSAYSASKHFLNSLTANLRMELAGTGIHVSTLSPGVVKTNFGLAALHGGVDSRALPNAQTAEQVAEVFIDLVAHPKADVYSQPQFRAQAAAYYGADDMAAFEAQVMMRR